MTATFNGLEPGIYAVQMPPRWELRTTANSHPSAAHLIAGTCQRFARLEDAIGFVAENRNHRVFEVREVFVKPLGHICVASDITPLPRFLSEAAAGR